jgi:tetratricopeptide (TPR) repeat protein
MTPFEAAQVLFKEQEQKQAFFVLQSLWTKIEEHTLEEFKIFGALVELSCDQHRREVLDLLDSVLSGEGGFRSFLERRSLAEQAVLLDWQGQIAFVEKDSQMARDSLSRAASLGRDTSLIWRLLGELYIDQGDLDIAIRYVRRSLQIYRQLELNLVSGREYPLGFFSGVNPLRLQNNLDTYLGLLLKVTKTAKSQKNLKGVREIVLEMMHQFPLDERLPKIRTLLEKNWVDLNLRYEPIQSLPRKNTQSVNRLTAPSPHKASQALADRRLGSAQNLQR